MKMMKELSGRSKFRQWSRLPVSVRVDRWLRAVRHRHLIRVDVTRITPEAAQQWYMTNIGY